MMRVSVAIVRAMTTVERLSAFGQSIGNCQCPDSRRSQGMMSGRQLVISTLALPRSPRHNMLRPRLAQHYSPTVPACLLPTPNRSKSLCRSLERLYVFGNRSHLADRHLGGFVLHQHTVGPESGAEYLELPKHVGGILAGKSRKYRCTFGIRTMTAAACAHVSRCN